MSAGETPPELPPPARKLFPVKGVVLATVIGSPIAGGIVLALNYSRLGRPEAARRCIVLTAAATALLGALAALLPEDARLAPLLGLVEVSAMYVAAWQLQGAAIRKHLRSGGESASLWAAAGIGALCLLALLVIVLAVAVFLVPVEDLGQHSEFDFNENDTVYCFGDATEDDAGALAAALTACGYLGDPEGTHVGIRESGGRYTVLFPLIEDAWKDSENVAYFRELGETLSPERFPRPLGIALCDGELELRVWLEIE